MALKFKKKPKLKLKAAPAPEPEAPQNVPEKPKAKTKVKDSEKFPKNTIVREEGHPRRVNTYSVLWIEVFASKDEDEVEEARKALLSIVASNYTLLDKESGDRMVMTSETFYADGRRAILDAGLKPWGVE